jgi:hypothetical protein
MAGFMAGPFVGLQAPLATAGKRKRKSLSGEFARPRLFSPIILKENGGQAPHLRLGS